MVTTTGQLLTWGANGDGQLGLGDHNQRKTPTLVEKLKNVADVVVSQHHTIVLDKAGRLYSCGRGRYSDSLRRLLSSSCMALGHKDNANLWSFKLIETLKDVEVVQVSTGYDGAMALDRQGKVWNWGRHEFGTSGMGNKQAATPVPNTVLNNLSIQKQVAIKKIDSCADFSSVLLDNGELYSFGNNDYSIMGIGEATGFETSESINYPTPIRNEDKSYPLFLDFALGEMTSLFFSPTGEAFVCGQKKYHYPTPFPADLKGIKIRSFTACDKGAAVLTEDNRLYCMGNFWCKAPAKVSNATGLVEVDTEKVFGGKVLQIGGKYSFRYAIVED